MASIWVEFVGILQNETGTSKLQINIDAPITVSTMIERLKTSFKLKQNLLLEHETGHLRQNTLTLVNGKDINVLEGLETKLKDDDIITIIQISHGG
ncbi:MoaD/ThiS family protein [Candidatus Bathyarchaeota archaeon]|nr:MoaD/ThiS family protein [Candidatus Bathyarchaeota archaeon]